MSEWCETNVKVVGVAADMASAIPELLQFKEQFRGICGNTLLGFNEVA